MRSFFGPWFCHFKRSRHTSLAAALLLLGVIAAAPSVGQSVTSFARTTAVGQQSAGLTFTLLLNASGTSIAPIVVSEGVPNVDFTVTGGSCAAGVSYTAGDTCSATVVFAPQRPGRRWGAVLLESDDGRLLASVLFSGFATGGLPVLQPGRIDTVAGTTTWVYQGDNVLATGAPIFLPMGVAVDPAGNLYLADSYNYRIRRVDAQTGLISTVAGTGSPGYSGDGGPAAAAMITNPAGLLLDGAGDLLFADTNNNAVRRIDKVTGDISTVAGTPGVQGYAGDGGAATAARLSLPEGIAFDVRGDLLIADTGNNVVRKVDAATGEISTLAGTGIAGYNGDGQLPTAAELNAPWSVAVTSNGSVMIADFANNRVREIDAVTGNIETAAGNGTASFSGDGDAATSAGLSSPTGLALDPAGNLYIADSENNRVREVNTTTGVIQTIAGTDSQSFSGDSGPSTSASLHGPYALFFDSDGNLFVADMFNNRVRRISAGALSLEYPTMRVGKISTPQPEGLINDGNDTLNLQLPTLDNAALDTTTTTCASALDIDDTCIFGVEFAPTITGSSVQGSVTVGSDAESPAPVISLSGEVLSVNPTTVTLTSSQNPSLVGSGVTFTAKVSNGGASSLSGTVIFSADGAQLCSTTLDSNGGATCSTSALSLGQHNIVASYGGDTEDAAGVSSTLVQIVKQQPTLTLTVVPNPSVVTGNVTLTLTATAPTGTPSGTITFFDGTETLGTATLNGAGVASFATSGLVPGTHPLSAQYSGDATNGSGQSNTVSEVVSQAATATALATSDADPTVGQSITLTATVSSANGLSPTGTVTFTDGSTILGTATLDASEVATLTLSSLAPGTHAIVASYAGDTDNVGSSSVPLAETVAQIATVTTLASDANPLRAGATLHLTATVAVAPGAAADGALTGQVTFSDGATTLGVATLDGSGHATLSTSALAVGDHTLTATYGGATNYATSTSAGFTQKVQKTDTSIAVTPAATTVLAGETATFTATVTSATGTPTGTVSFLDGGVVLGTAALNAQGVATFSLSTLNSGTHTLTATYDGDANYSASTSAAWSETVNLAQPVLTLSGPSNPVDVGATVTLTGTMTSPGIVPTGTLTLRDGGITIATQTVSGAFSFSTSSLAVGSHTLTVTYSGDSDNASVTSSAVMVTIQLAPTATALGSSANPGTFGKPVVFTASVVSDSPSPTGTVSFLDGTVSLGTAALSGSGSASVTTSSLSFGVHNITAVYSGDADHATSTSTAVSERILEPSTATLASSANPAVAGADVVFTATILASGGQTPTGTVTFRDGAATVGTVALDANGTAVLHISSLAVGQHTISAVYAGDTNVAAASASLTQTVQIATTQVTLTAGANPATYASPLTLTATVASNGGNATGTVTFLDGGTPIGSATLNAQQVATLTLSTLMPGTHTVVASYAGNGRANASVSEPLTLAVKQTTTLALTSSANPALTVSPITLTAVITNSGAAPPSGSVVFTEGALQLGTAALDANGRASITLPSLSAGSHVITASYAGDAGDFASSPATLTQTVNLQPTTTTLSGSQTNSANPQQVTLIAVVHGGANVVPTGIVSFTSGTITVGTAAVDATGVATLTILIEDPSGTEAIEASYQGDSVYASSISEKTTVQAGQATQFSLTIDPERISVVTKQRTTVSLGLTSIKGFNDTIQFGCLGLPFAATCTFSTPQTKLEANGTATVQLTVDTGNPLGAGAQVSRRDTGHGHSNILLCLLPGSLLLGLAFRRRALRRLPGLLLLCCALMLTFAASGCAGLQGSGTPPGTYTFKVTASGQGTGATQSQVVTLTVTQ